LPLVELTKRRKGYRKLLAKYLYDSHRLRLQADYDQESVSSRQAEHSIRWAREFVADVEEKVLRQ